jgi:serine phosphatase RsbU (regulator of sigma subunit)
MFDLIAANAEKSAAEIFKTVVDAVTAFHEGAGPQEDDITLVVIKAL